MNSQDTDTIVAIATAAGRGGVGIVRVSGAKALTIAKQILDLEPRPRFAHYGPFRNSQHHLIDMGIALYFPGPNSFTGEDVLELQGHGGPIVMDALLNQCTQLGARIARPGEFSERAFLNGKLDIAQAEAIADLIDSNSQRAAANALKSLQGEFSKRVNQLVEAVLQLRIYVEAAIDFPEEEIDFLSDGKVTGDLRHISEQLTNVLHQATIGTTIQEGIQVVLAGLPNAGKSSLLNALAGNERAIVTDLPGTTRDILKEQIMIDGVPLHIVDTAGLRESQDIVEQEGIRRAWQAIKEADQILYLVDSALGLDENQTAWQRLYQQADIRDKLTLVLNKIDLQPKNNQYPNDITSIQLSTKTGTGLPELRKHLLNCVGLNSGTEGTFSARRRHLDALERAQQLLTNAVEHFTLTGAGELLAEDLKRIQDTLGEITGQILPDDLLGHIFSSFCIGK